MRTRPTQLTKQLLICLSPSQVKAINKTVKRIQKKRPDAKLSRNDIMREIIMNYVDSETVASEELEASTC